MSPNNEYQVIRAKATEHLDAGRHGPALELFLRAEPLAKDADLCGLLGDMAVAYHNVGNTARAVRTYVRAIEVCRQQGDDVNLSRWCQNLALIRIGEGALDEAHDLISEAISAAKRSGDAYQYSTAMGNRAMAFMEKDAFGHAVEALQEAERSATKSPNLRVHWRRSLVTVNLSWAIELVKRRAWHEARARARAALDYGSTANDEDKLQQAYLHRILPASPMNWVNSALQRPSVGRPSISSSCRSSRSCKWGAWG